MIIAKYRYGYHDDIECWPGWDQVWNGLIVIMIIATYRYGYHDIECWSGWDKVWNGLIV